jgi:hypothetical protein
MSRSLASVAKDHPTHLMSQPFDFAPVDGTPEALGDFEKLFLFLLFRFHQQPVGTQATGPRHRSNLRRETCR